MLAISSRLVSRYCHPLSRTFEMVTSPSSPGSSRKTFSFTSGTHDRGRLPLCLSRNRPTHRVALPAAKAPTHIPGKGSVHIVRWHLRPEEIIRSVSRQKRQTDVIWL